MKSIFFKLFFTLLFIFLFLKLIFLNHFLFSFLQKKSEIKKEIENLRYQNALWQAKAFELEKLKKENFLLKEALKIKEKENKKIILANVIGISPFNFDPCFLIDKGKKDGIKKGDIVLLNEKIVVGKIKEVKENFSKVATFFDKENSASVILEKSNLLGSLKVKNQKIFLDLIPKNASLDEGENVYTSGFDFKYPRGFLIGKVKKIEKKENEPFLKIEIELPYRWDELTQVILMEK